jgi:hypothetical protein
MRQNQMKSLINLKYSTIDDAADALGSVQVIREAFVGFQQYLYKSCVWLGYKLPTRLLFRGQFYVTTTRIGLRL